MSIWNSIYARPLLLHLLSLALIFGVLWPVLWFLLIAGFRMATRFVQWIGRNVQFRQGHLS